MEILNLFLHSPSRNQDRAMGVLDDGIGNRAIPALAVAEGSAANKIGLTKQGVS